MDGMKEENLNPEWVRYQKRKEEDEKKEEDIKREYLGHRVNGINPRKIKELLKKYSELDHSIRHKSFWCGQDMYLDAPRVAEYLSKKRKDLSEKETKIACNIIYPTFEPDTAYYRWLSQII